MAEISTTAVTCGNCDVAPSLQHVPPGRFVDDCFDSYWFECPSCGRKDPMPYGHQYKREAINSWNALNRDAANAKS